MNYVHIVAVLAVLQFFIFGILVGRSRAKYGVRAPAKRGPGFLLTVLPTFALLAAAAVGVVTRHAA